MTPAVVFVTRTVLRSRIRSVAALALVVALGAGVAMGAAAGARRAGSAGDRLLAVSAVPEAFVFTDSAATFDSVAALPEVTAASGFTQLGLHPASVPCDDQNAHYFPVLMPVAGEPFATPRPRVVAGHLADPADAGQVVLSEQHARRLGVGVGDTIAYRRIEVTDEGEPVGCSDDVVAELEVVGVIRELNEIGAGDEPTIASTWVTPAFGAAHPEVPTIGFAPVTGFVGLAPGTSPSRFVDTLAERVGRGDDTAGGLPIEPNDSFSAVLDAHAVGLTILAGVFAVAMLATFAAGIARQVGTFEDELHVVGALGFARRQLTLVASAGGAAAVLVGALLAGALSVALSAVHLFGLAATVEPDPGIDVDPTVLVGGVGAVIVAGAAITVTLAWRRAGAAMAANRARPDHRRGLSDRLAGLGLAPPAAIGAGYALDGGSRTSLPSRAAVLGVGGATAALVAVLLFGAGVSRASTEPAVYGWGGWDGWVAADDDSPGEEIDPAQVLAGDDRVDTLASVQLRFKLPLAGEPRSGVAVEDLQGRSGPTVVRGRLPRGASEIALGAATAEQLGVGMGDDVEAGGPAGDADLRVVGIVAFPSLDGGAIAAGWVADRAAVDALGWPAGCNDDSECLDTFAVGWRSGVDSDAMAVELAAAGLDLTPPAPGAEVSLMSEVDRLPAVAAAGIAVLAAVGLIHTLVVTLSRRRRDLATLRALGYERRHVARVLHAEGLTLGLVGGTVGGIVGAVVGDAAWQAAAQAIGIGPELPSSTTLVVAAAAVASVVLFAGLVALGPAALAGRHEPAAGLRAEG